MGTIAQTFNPSIPEEEVGGLCELKAILASQLVQASQGCIDRSQIDPVSKSTRTLTNQPTKQTSKTITFDCIYPQIHSRQRETTLLFQSSRIFLGLKHPS